MTQFVLDLPRRVALSRTDFLVSSSNAVAIGWIDRWPNWPSAAVVLYGPPGCGKTHLAHLWCERAGAILVAGRALDETNLRAVLAAGSRRMAVDGADQAEERALLHLYNWCLECGGSLLVTTRHPPGRWEIELPDLGSRLRSAAAAGVEMPDDALLGAVLVKHFADRQKRVGPGLIAYLVGRIERSFAVAAEVVSALDAAALADHRPITIPLARRVLAAKRSQSLPPGNDSAVT